MNKSNVAQNEHDNVQLLLPWYLNSTLSEIESARVRQHVNNCGKCKADAELVDAMLDVAVPAQVSVDASDERLKRVFNRIDAYEKTQRESNSASTGFMQDLIEQMRLMLQPARLIPVASVAVLAAVLSMQFLYTPDSGSEYEVRTSQAVADGQLELLITLDTTLSSSDINSLLEGAGVSHQWDSRSDTEVVIKLPANIAANDMFTLIEQLEQQQGVSSVETSMPKN